MSVKIRKGDTVVIISGGRNDKGKRGEVIKVLPDEQKVIVQGVNVRKKHQKQVQSQGQQLHPGIIEFEAPVDISNVMLVCPECHDNVRVNVIRDEVGLPHRVCKKCGKQFD